MGVSMQTMEILYLKCTYAGMENSFPPSPGNPDLVGVG